MATIKQIEANRLNAQKSTGPRSVEGKSRSSMNALKSGIDAQSETITGEDPAALEALTAEYLERFRPATPEERHCVDVLVRDEWLLRRLAKAEAQLWEYQIQATSGWMDRWPLGKAWSLADGQFSRLQRRIDSLERSYQRALRELERLQSLRPDPEPAPQRPENPRPSREIGFVPSSQRWEDDAPVVVYSPPNESHRSRLIKTDPPPHLLKIPA
jgi:hypothetical protein